jgi:hypothetical protein
MPALLYVVLLLAALGTSSIDVTSVGGPALCQTHKEDLTSEFGCDANPVPALELHGTALEGTCQGEAYYVIPPRVTFDGRDETGVAELFLWQPVDEFGVQDVAFAKVFCEGGPAISGGGSGGILRIVFIDRDGMGPVLCRYNGANESGCTGTFGRNLHLGCYFAGVSAFQSQVLPRRRLGAPEHRSRQQPGGHGP